MDILNLMDQFNNEESCWHFIAAKRWGDSPCCPRCGSVDIRRKSKTDIKRGYNCTDCTPSFNAKTGIFFQNTQIPLQKWIVGIFLISNAKKNISSCQLARDLDMNQKSAWYLEMRIRKAMEQGDELLKGIVEVDEVYVGGKPRRGRDKNSKRGRGTKKTPVVGIAERKENGMVTAHEMENVTGENLKDYILDKVSTDESVLMTDQFSGYNAVDGSIERHVINHSARYVSENGFVSHKHNRRLLGWD